MLSRILKGLPAIVAGHYLVMRRHSSNDYFLIGHAADGTHLRTFHYEQPTDPGAVGAGKTWLNTTDENALVVARRNAANTDWVFFSSSVASGFGTGGYGDVPWDGTVVTGTLGTTLLSGLVQPTYASVGWGLLESANLALINGLFARIDALEAA